MKIVSRLLPLLAGSVLLAGCASLAEGEGTYAQVAGGGVASPGDDGSASATPTDNGSPSATATDDGSTSATPTGDGGGGGSDDGTVDVTSGSWEGIDSDGDLYNFTFEEGGHVRFSSPSGDYDDPEDTWSLEGNRLTISISDGYAIYEATVQGDVMTGSARNEPGHEWTFTYIRIP